MSAYCWPVRVYYEDTDAGGVVYYANYLKFMERARSEWLRSLGIEQDQLRQDDGVLLMVHKLHMHYVKSARFNAQLRVSVQVKSISPARIGFIQQIWEDEQLLCQGEVSIACVNEQTGKACAFPEQLVHVLKGV